MHRYIMNYKQIHDRFIDYIKESTPRARLAARNPNDQRLMKTSIYQEVHHIIPRSLGGTDELYNLVAVLPEEHIFLHMLRYKIYRRREDMLAVRFTLNGYNCGNEVKGRFKFILNKKIRMGYAWLKAHSSHLRKTEGWQTDEGRQRISKARKGTIVVKDKDTNVIVGSVATTHPNILTGQWVHHMRGRKISSEERLMRSEIGSGSKNNNYSGLTDEYLIDKGVELYNEFGYILKWPDLIKLSEARNFKWIKGVAKCRFNGLGKRGFYAAVKEQLQIK